MTDTMKVSIEGMSCGHCVQRVRGSLESVEGVRVLDVEIGSARVEVDPDRADPERVKQAIRNAGFQPA